MPSISAILLEGQKGPNVYAGALILNNHNRVTISKKTGQTDRQTDRRKDTTRLLYAYTATDAAIAEKQKNTDRNSCNGRWTDVVFISIVISLSQY